MTKARTAARDATPFNEPSLLPLCSQCLINRLTRQDKATGCIRCKACRRSDPAPKSNPDKPTNLESWWLLGQTRDEQDAWFARARAELDRMCGSKEFKVARLSASGG
jgi:hypothetical protein